MRSKIATIIILFIIFLCFTLFHLNTQKYEQHKVLDIIRADLFYVDINDNSKIDKNELFKLKDVYTFSNELNDFTKTNSKKLHLSQINYMKAGYLAQNWALDNLKGSNIEITAIIEDKTKNYNYIAANLKGKDLAEFYLTKGLAYPKADSNYVALQNNIQIKNNIKEISKLDFVLLNLNSNTYHKPDCNLVNTIHKAKLILKSDANKYKPCKSCIISSTDKFFKIPKKTIPTFYKQSGIVEIFFTNPLIYKKPDKSCSNTPCKILLKEINSTKSSIDMALYGFGNIEAIYNALVKAKERGVKIRAVADYSLKMDSLYPKTKQFIKDFDAKTDENEVIMHNKYFIFDNTKVFTGSANISPSDIGGYNANSMILINSAKIAAIYKNEFNQMYSGKFSTSKQVQNVVTENNITPYFSPKSDIKRAILSKINSAHDEICVSAFYLTNRDIINALIASKQRNVKVYILLDAVSANNFKERVYLMRKSGLNLIIENWGGKNHEKTMLIDKKILIIGSLNFSNAGLNKNDENILIIENNELAKTYRNYFFYLYNSIDKKFLYQIPRAEGKESINSCNDGIDNNYDEHIDKEDEGCK